MDENQNENNGFNINLGGLSTLHSLFQDIHDEGTQLNQQNIDQQTNEPHQTVVQEMSKEEKKQQKKKQYQEKAKLKRKAQKAGFNTTEEYQQHLDSVNQMYEASRQNTDAIQEQHENNLPKSGTIASIQRVHSGLNQLQNIAQLNTKKNFNSAFYRPANLANADSTSRALQKIQQQYVPNQNRGIPIDLPPANLAKPYIPTYQTRNVNQKPTFDFQTALPSGIDQPNRNQQTNNTQDDFFTQVNKANQNKSEKEKKPSEDKHARPWWEKMQDTLDDIRDDLRKVLEALNKMHGANGELKIGAKKNVEEEQKSNSGLLSNLGPLAAVIGGMMAAKFGGISAQITGSIKNVLEEFGKSSSSIFDKVKNDISNGTKSVAQTIDKIEQPGTSLMARGVGEIATISKNANNFFSQKSKTIPNTNIPENIPEPIKPNGFMEGIANFAKNATKGAANVLSTPLKYLHGGAMAFGGWEASVHGTKAYEKFRTGDNIGGTAETLRTAAKVEEFGGPKNMLGAIPFVGPTLSKYTPDVVKSATNTVLREGYRRIKSGVVTGAAVDAVGGGIANPIADVGGVAGFVGGLIAPQLAAKGLNYTADRLDSKQGRSFIHSAQEATSNTYKGLSQGWKEGDKNFGTVGAVVEGASGGIVGAGMDVLKGLSKLLPQHKENSANTHEQVEKVAQQQSSVAEKAQQLALNSNSGRFASTGNVTNNSPITININKADITSEASATKIMKEVAQKTMQAQKQQQKAQEMHSANTGTGFFGTIQNDVNSLISKFI